MCVDHKALLASNRHPVSHRIRMRASTQKLTTVKLNVRLQGALRTKLFTTLITGMRLDQLMDGELVHGQLFEFRKPHPTLVALIGPTLWLMWLHMVIHVGAFPIATFTDAAYPRHGGLRIMSQLLMLAQWYDVGESLVADDTLMVTT